MKICIYGAGAVGGLIAARLARSSHEVCVVRRGAQLEALRENGLRVRDRESGAVEAFSVKADSEPARLGGQDYVIVAVKGQNLTDVALHIEKLFSKDTTVLTAMNGVPGWFFDRLSFGNGTHRLESLDPAGTLARAIPTERIVGCVVHLAASTPEPGLLSHNMGKRLIIGEPGGKNGPRTARLKDAPAGAGFEAGVRR